MKQFVPDWFIQVLWFIAGVFATGAFWYFLSVKNEDSTIVSGVAAIVFAGTATYLHRLNDRSFRLRKCREKLANYIDEINKVLQKIDEKELPILEHNIWVESVEKYLSTELDQSFVIRFSDFSGLVFYGDGTEKSKFKNSISGRVQRLSQFISELS